MVIDLLCLVLGAGLVLAIAATHVRLRRAVRWPAPEKPALAAYPSLSVIHPVRGLDVGAAENITAGLDTGYPGELEVIFVFDDESEPVLPLVQAAMATHRAAGRPGTGKVLIAGAPPPGRTGKLNAMIVGAKEARGELIAFSDSDIRPGKEELRVLVDALMTTPRAGSAFAPVNVPGPLLTAGDVGYALLLNGLYGPSVSRAAELRGELPFIMGQLMVFRREVLGAIGGPGCAMGQLVDDMHIGICVTRAGYRNIMVPVPVPIIEKGVDLAEFARTYRRWILFSRSGLPWLWLNWPSWLTYAASWVGLGLCLLALSSGHYGAALLPAFAVAAAALSVVGLHRVYGGAKVPLRLFWAPVALLLSGPLVLLATYVMPRVNWRGRIYALNQQARLAGAPADDAPGTTPGAETHPARP